MIKINSKHFQRILEEIDGGTGQVDVEVLENTAGRMSRSFAELLSGYETDPKSLLERTFESDFSEMVIVSNIKFASLCEHHLSLIDGIAHVGYIPDGKLLGLSKIARLVECYSRRLILQERMTAQIAGSIMEYVAPLGVAVVTDAVHSCVSTRGVNKPGSRTIVSSMKGIFKDDEKARSEFLRLIKNKG